MPGEAKPTGAVNGGLWGARARDWAELQEGQCRPVYEAVLDRLKVGPAMAYLDAGCGAGMAAADGSRAWRARYRGWTLQKPCWP